MRTFGKFLGRLLLVVALAVSALYVFGPYEDISLAPSLQTADVEPDVEAHFAKREARFDDITPGVQKRVAWFADAGDRTALSIVYVHGFSATSEEIRPVPDAVAQALGANLVYTRLQGHGRDGDALAAATVQGWIDDVAEAVYVAGQISDQVVIMSTSTGGTLAAALADHPDVMAKVKGIIFVSPNFGIKSPAARLLTWPAARQWVPLVAGRERSFDPTNDAHERYWTTQYPTVAVLQMAELVKQVFEKDFSAVTVPALFWFALEDQVVDASKTQEIAARWGGPVTVAIQAADPEADNGAHVIAGDIMSPSGNAAAISGFVKFIRELSL